tara:strand:- start:117 stop:824 length:708 start_codon:yes stop_codon:yes gene_type:complete
MKKMKKNNYILLSILLLASLYFIFKQLDEQPQLIGVTEACGNYPENYQFIDIENDPNFVFKGDPAYNSVLLWDVEGNSVNVNSFRECEHYVNGGWNHVPETSVEQISTKLNCDEYLRYQGENDYLLDLIEINNKEFFKNLDCVGAIKQVRYDDSSIKILEVYNSKFFNLIFSQLLLIVFILFIKKVKKIYFLLVPIYALAVSLYFNFLLDLNIINFVFFSNTLIATLYLYENYES